MNIFLTVIGVILGILLLVFLLIYFLVVKLFVEYDTDTGKLAIYAKAFFIRYDIYPIKPEKSRKKALKKLKKQEKKKSKKLEQNKTKPLFSDEDLKKLENDAKGAAETQETEKKPTLSERIKHFTELVRSITDKIKILAPAVLSAIKLEIKRLDVVVGGKDAASAAISYGAVCASIEGLYAIEKAGSKLKVSDKVYVAVDYCGEGFRADMSIGLHIRIAKLIIPAIKAFIL